MARDELHVDGGTTRKVFIAPLQISLRSLYQIGPEWKPAEADLLSIAKSSLAAINKSYAAGDLFRLYLLATRVRMYPVDGRCRLLASIFPYSESKSSSR